MQEALWGVNGLDEICIIGGKPLQGKISVQGSKNAALPMMAAALLHRGISVLEDCPAIADVFCMEEILHKLGAATWWDKNCLYLDCTLAEGTEISGVCTGRMRSSVMLLAPLLARNKKASMGYPGGCVIGKRPVDQHLYVLRMLGASIEETDYEMQALCSGFHGGEVHFVKKSVGATEQGILAAVTAKGDTVLHGCAAEPEIKWLCSFLRSMGARIKGEGTDCICITGTSELGPGYMRIPPDRIVAGTYLCAAAATRGKIEILNAPAGEMDAFLEVYGKMGGQYNWNSGKLIADGSRVSLPLPFLETEVYPGFPTDLQSPLMAVLTTIEGESVIRENIFENRFRLVEDLVRMGASIEVKGREARIHGGNPLRGCRVKARELRGGAALIVAALAAEGETQVCGCSFIHRGYEHICEDLFRLGGQIKECTGI